jgi:hypothetical protein
VTPRHPHEDGQIDVAVPQIGGSSASVGIFFGNGNGTFTTSGALIGTPANPNDATLADVNGDGRPDVFTANAGTDGLGSIFLRLNGTPTFGVELRDAAGSVVASGGAGVFNYDRGLTFTPAADGTYYGRVFSTGAGPLTAGYKLVVTRGAVFDTELNETAATA